MNNVFSVISLLIEDLNTLKITKLGSTERSLGNYPLRLLGFAKLQPESLPLQFLLIQYVEIFKYLDN